jgi:hypothetical protein
MPTMTIDVPDELAERIERAAAAAGRSPAAEAVRVLDEGVRRPGPLPPGGDAPSEADNFVMVGPRPLDFIPVTLVAGGPREPAVPIIMEETPE